MDFQKYSEAIKRFDLFEPFTSQAINRRIEENRKGTFVIRVLDKDGNPIPKARLNIKLNNHEFKFGCSLFLLNQFDDENKNKLYEQRFNEMFNYGVAPLYWDTLEPEKGNPRYGVDSKPIYRRPPVDSVVAFAKTNNIKLKGHCLMYNSFNPDWMPREPRELRIAVEERMASLAERYGNDFVDLDVINEMYGVYQNAYGELGHRDFPITDDFNHEEWCFDLAKKYFPHSRLFWNEGCYESFGNDQYTGNKSRYYLMLKNKLNLGAKIEGIGMQYHAFDSSLKDLTVFNPEKLHDVFNLYSEFGLPIHLSEISVPAYELAGGIGEDIQAELTRRLYSLWFSEKNVEGCVWWNMADGTAFGNENKYCAGLLNNDLSPKKVWKVMDELINHTWHTEENVLTDDEGMAVIRGFYGDYDIIVDENGHHKEEKVRLCKDNTGYYHYTGKLKEAKIII